MYLKEETINTIVIEKSRFICYMKRVRSEDEYRQYVSEIRKKHHDATHVCSAMICHNIRRSSDDGEPSGTAGAPILNVLDKNGLDETCALVVRYFGGIKLGAGGLIRAYSSATSECLKIGKLAMDAVLNKYQLKLSYETANRIERYLREHSILIDTIYDTDVTYIFALEDESVIEKIKEFTKGVLPEKIGEEILQKEVK
ncbi:MAG: YigZ family protein [Erysipelotrichaceae bacterium]|nr:YigZ family protein [Erysipelotrichaceae bacterium]MBQ2232485.1 YigZ family protein [Erysipelotrichaceae bacterium]